MERSAPPDAEPPAPSVQPDAEPPAPSVQPDAEPAGDALEPARPAGEAAEPVAAPPAEPAGAPADRDAAPRRSSLSVGLVAVATWAVTLPVGLKILLGFDLNPLEVAGVTAPLVYGALVGLVLLGVSLRLRSPSIVGVAAGLYASWCGVVVAAALNGTPFGYGSQLGDAGRMSAMATHFSHTWRNVSVGDPSAPSEYPPFYPMLLGRAARLFDVPAWTTVAWSQVLLVSIAVLAAFLMWSRLLPAAPSLVLAAMLGVAFAEPSKANEMLVLGVLLPTVLATFAPLPPAVRPLNPVAAGVIFGLIVPWHPSHLVLSLVGIACLMVLGWRATVDRIRYVVRVAVTVAVAVVVSSWFTVPLIVAYLTRRTQVVADQYISAGYPIDPMPVLGGQPPVQALVAVGILGVVALWRVAWWARPMAVYLVALLAVQALMFARLVAVHHTFMLPYVKALVLYTLLVCGVLTVWHGWTALVRPRLASARMPAYAVGVVVVAGVLASTAAHGWAGWMPSPRGAADASSPPPGGPNYATFAHQEFLADGSRPRYATEPTRNAPWFPSDQVAAEVRKLLGPEARPTTLSYDQRLFSYHAWPNWLPTSRTSSSSLLRWDDRREALRRLEAIEEPVDFAAASAATEFGSIDVFVLKRVRQELRWTSPDFDAVFSPSQFATGFTVVFDLPENTFVAVRLVEGPP